MALLQRENVAGSLGQGTPNILEHTHPSPGEAGPITVCGELEGTFGEGSKPANGRMPCSEKGHGSEC